MYNKVKEKIAILELFNPSELPMQTVPSKKVHPHDRKFYNYLTMFTRKSKPKGKKWLYLYYRY